MLDIKLFRENPELIFDSEKKRFRGTDTAEKVIEYDTLWREGEKRLNFLRSEKNRLSKSFKKAKQEGNLEEVIAKSKEVANEIKELGPKIEEYKKLRDDYRYKVGNIIDEDVPISDTEDDNKIVKEYGEIPEFDFEPLNHVDLIEKIDGADMKTAAQIAGARFYYLKRDILHLNLALIQFALNELESKGYIPLQTPFFVKGIKKLKGNLSGIICNCRNVDHEKEIVSEFASKIGTRIIGTINRSNLIQESELDAKTVVEKYPESKEASEYEALATNIMENKVFTTPEPMDDEEFEKFFKSFLE